MAKNVQVTYCSLHCGSHAFKMLSAQKSIADSAFEWLGLGTNGTTSFSRYMHALCPLAQHGPSIYLNSSGEMSR